MQNPTSNPAPSTSSTPMPQQMPQATTRVATTPRDVFFYLLMIVTLYIAVIAFITLLINFVNFSFPSVTDFDYLATYAGGAILNSMAAVIVAWPIYVLMAWLIGRDIKKEPAKRDLRVRKWLLYLTLFIAAITIIIDLVTVTYNFLSGEFTIKFFLKVLSVLLVTGGVFGYYLWELRRKVGEQSNLPRVLAWVTSGILLAVFVMTFIVVGTPAELRAKRLDDQRVSHLMQIQNEVFNYYSTKNTLPPSIEALRNDVTGFIPPVDPETGVPYEYQSTGALAFQLCGTFTTESKATQPRIREVITSFGPVTETWAHAVGRACFDRTIDPDLFQDTGGIPNSPGLIKPVL